MKIIPAAILVALVAPLAVAEHYPDCVIGGADPSTYLTIQLPDGRMFYVEERNSPTPGVPFSGFLFADGTWTWQEANGLVGLQRGGYGMLGPCFPPEPLPCLGYEDYAPYDVTCHHGHDNLVF